MRIGGGGGDELSPNFVAQIFLQCEMWEKSPTATPHLQKSWISA